MTFPTTLDTDFGTLVDNVDDAEASNINELRRAVEGLEAKVGINSSAVTASLDYKVNNFFVSGRKLYLYENTAPTGWTIVAVTDKVLAVKGGSDAYNISGGNTGGTWTQPSHTHTMSQPSGSSQREGTYNTDCAHEDHIHTIYGSATAITYRPAACVGIIVSKDA